MTNTKTTMPMGMTTTVQMTTDVECGPQMSAFLVNIALEQPIRATDKTKVLEVYVSGTT